VLTFVIILLYFLQYFAQSNKILYNPAITSILRFGEEPLPKLEISLEDALDIGTFRYIERSFRRHFELPLETLDLRGIPVKGRCSSRCTSEFCRLVSKAQSGENRCYQDRLRSLTMAFETGQPYETLCHAGLFLVCIPVMERELPLGGIFFGRCLSEPLDDTAVLDMTGRLQDLRIDPSAFMHAAEQLPVMGARKIHQAAQHLFILLYERTKLDPRVIHWRRFKTDQQARIGEIIQESKSRGGVMRYPYEREYELMEKVRAGDRVGAREILNEILGAILFSNPGKIDILKARLVELLSILSRGAVEFGLGIESVLERNVGYINKVLSLGTQDEICAWISAALNDFIEDVYGRHDVSPRDPLVLAQNFIKRRFGDPLNVRRIAAEANLSESRLSHLFRERLGTTVIEYLLSVRLNRAKTLLLTTNMTCTEIALEAGFNDPSYFTRCFRKKTGFTPRKFRNDHRDQPKDRLRVGAVAGGSH
jgi:two-component system response regulator YesN